MPMWQADIFGKYLSIHSGIEFLESRLPTSEVEFTVVVARCTVEGDKLVHFRTKNIGTKYHAQSLGIDGRLVELGIRPGQVPPQ